MSDVYPWYLSEIYESIIESLQYYTVLLLSFRLNVPSQWAKFPKNSLRECVFINSALKVQCHIVSALKVQCHIVKIHSYFFGDFAHWNSPYQLKVVRVGNMRCCAETELFVTVSLQVWPHVLLIWTTTVLDASSIVGSSYGIYVVSKLEGFRRLKSEVKQTKSRT